MHAGNLPSHLYYAPMSPLAEDEACGYEGDGWYFWDETEAFVIGPYDTFEAAEIARGKYKP